MVQQRWCRILFGMVVVVSVFIFIITTEMEIELVIHEFPRPMSLFGNIGMDQSVPKKCQCSMSRWRKEKTVKDALSLFLPWSNVSTREELQQQHPNIPIEIFSGNKKCSLLPTLFSIEWKNRHWQEAKLNDSGSFFLYSAFLDPETGERASLRLLGVSKSISPGAAWCQLWFSAHAPPTPVLVDRVDYLDYQRKSSDHQMPYLLRCPLPPNITQVPLAVSLSAEPCKRATNLLKVIGGWQREKSAYRGGKVPDKPATLLKGWEAAVCGPALFYYHEDFSIRLVEWLELLRAMGFRRVFLYATDIHPNMTKVLHHYVREGFVHLTDYNYPPPYLNEPSLRRLWTLVERNKMFAQENVYFSDCLLRHMHQYRFIAHFDPDEVPILTRHSNFSHLLDTLMEKNKDRPPPGYRFQWGYFFDNVEPSKEAAGLPGYLWALRHTGRQGKHMPSPTAGHFKSLYDMNFVRGVFSHGTLVCLSGNCHHSRIKKIPPNEAFLGHFKHTCAGSCLNETAHDLTLLQYKEQVATKVKEVMIATGLLESGK